MHRQSAADSHGRLLDAALTCIARVGWSKTTLDDVAREAGCARATVYRRYPGKQPLIGALVEREVERLGAEVRGATALCETLGDTAAVALTTAARALLTHDALTYVLTVEPEVLLPHIAFDRGDALLGRATDLFAPSFTPFAEPEHARRIAEWVARIGISYACSAEAAQLLDVDTVRQLVNEFVLPGLERPAPSTQGVLQ